MQVAGIDTAHYTQTDTICTEGSIHDGTHPQYSVPAGCSDFVSPVRTHLPEGRRKNASKRRTLPFHGTYRTAFGTSRLPADLYGIC